MTVLSREVEIKASAQELWEQLLAVNAWPEWQQSVTEARWISKGKPALGSRLSFSYQHNQTAPRVEAEITGLRTAREFSYRPVGGDVPYTEGMSELEWEWLLSEQSNGRTWLRFTLSYQADGGYPFVREVLGTRVQFLNFADSALKSLQSKFEAAGAIADQPS